MEIEVFDALRSAGVPDEKARAAVESINRQIDFRYRLHAEQLATRGDLAALRGDLRADLERVRGVVLTRIAESKNDVVRWCVGSIFASVGMFAAVTKLLVR